MVKVVRVFNRHTLFIAPLSPRAKIHSYVLVAEHFECNKTVCGTVATLAVCNHLGILWDFVIYLHQLTMTLEDILIYVFVPINVNGSRNMTCIGSPNRGAFVLLPRASINHDHLFALDT